MPTSTWDNALNVLCVRLDSIGDVLMTTPAIRAVKRSRAGRRVTLLTSPAGAQGARLIPEVDDVMVYDAPWMKASPARADATVDEELLSQLRSKQFAAAAIFTVFSQNPLPAALLCYLANIPLRLAHCRENPYQLLTDWVAESEPERHIRHEVRRQLDLVATVGCADRDERLSLRVCPRDAATTLRWLQSQELHQHRAWLVVHPGATAPSRRYPPELFAEAADVLAGEHGLTIVFTGGASEIPLVESIRARMRNRSLSLAGALQFGELAGLLAAAPLLITNNTGPAHMAAALGIPVVDLYALTNPQHTPWQTPHRVLYHDVPCKFCFRSVCPLEHHHCLTQVAPGRVVDAALELLAQTPADASDKPSLPIDAEVLA